MTILEFLKAKFESLGPHLNEKLTRLWAATEARALGRGGITKVSQATGLSPKTIRVGIRELDVESDTPLKHTCKQDKMRRQGSGRKRLQDIDPTLIPDLEALIEPVTRGHLESPLCWTSKSTEKLAQELRTKGHAISARKVASLLHQLNYSLQSHRKTKEGDSSRDRDAQFQHICDQVQEFQARSQPVIFVEVKKKEVIGDYKNNEQEWQLKKQPVEVNTYDFPDFLQLNKVVLCGVCELGANQGWVNVGINHDTAELAVESIRHWYRCMCQQLHPRAKKLLIAADFSGSNGYWLQLWKTQLQKLANESELSIQVAHFPPCTSKWNKIEHRMFCHMTHNRDGQLLTSTEVAINLIGSTTTKKGLAFKTPLDENQYELGKKVSEEGFSSVSLKKYQLHGEWNYMILPQTGLNNFSALGNK